MPATFTVAQHQANPVEESRYQGNRDAQGLLSQACREQGKQCAELLQSSLGSDQDFSTLAPLSNGFVRTVLNAYNKHHHLIIRPDDVWIAIVAQLNLYINAHAEELRHKFVAHEGKKELKVTAVGTRYTVDFGEMSRQMADLLDKNVSESLRLPREVCR
jgi:hypothetical protein